MYRALSKDQGILQMDKKVIEIAKQYADKVRTHLPVRMVVLYGSYAKGTFTKLSDIDIAVVVDKIGRDYLKISVDLFSMVCDIDKRIEPILLSPAHDRSGFLENIIKYGKIIYKL